MDSPASNTDQLLGEVAFVHRLARALLRDAESAHDVAQDALVAALQERSVRHARGWLAAVTRHLAGRTRREARERAAREARAARPPAHDGEERTAERLRLHRRLTDAVMALPEPYRTAVTLRFFDELSPRAIAQRLRLPTATVRQHVHRGLAMLRHQLDGEFGGRDRWRAAFAAIAPGKAAVPVLLWIPVFAMKKVAVVFLVAAVATGWWAWPGVETPPVAAQVATSPPSSAAAQPGNGALLGSAAKVDAERTAVTVMAARDDAFAVRVVDEREQPMAGANVHRWTIAGASSKQRTDRDGRVEFAALDGGGGLLVRADGHAPLLRELDCLRGDVLCTLPDGVVLDGTMLVDGAPAPAGLRLRVATGTVAPKSAPREIAELLAAYRPPSFVVTAPGGAFSFHGLEAGKQVTMVMPETHVLLPDEGLIDEVRDPQKRRTLLPARGVVLRATQLPTVYGRVVWADDGSPVESPELLGHVCFADGDNSMDLFVGGNEDGTFAAGFYPANSSLLRWLPQPEQRCPIVSVHMSASAAGSDGSARVDLDESALAALPVEVRLPRAVVTHFVVTDLNDHPIAGARVSRKPSTPTDEQGHGTFQCKRDGLLVGADGCQVQPAVSYRPAAGTQADPLHFRLAPRNHLLLRLRTPGGGLAQVRWVGIDSPCDLFCGKRFHDPTFDRTFGGSEASCGRGGRTQPDGSSETYRWDCTVQPDATGQITLHSLEPGLTCTARVVAALDTIVATASFVTPAAGETCTVDLVVSDAPRVVRGRVLARDGLPMPNASVQLRSERGASQARTGADGAFTFAGVYERGALDVEAKATGFANTRRQIVPADEPREHVLVLDVARRVTLRIVDEEGRPVDAPARAEQDPGESLHPQTLQPGEHLFTDLPPGIVTFESRLGGQTFTIAQDTDNPSAVLRVPRPARIVVGKPSDGSSTQNLDARVTRLDAAGEPFSVDIGARDAEANLLVPGRYRVDLYRVTWRGNGETREIVEETVAPAQEIEAKAGELVRVKF